VRQVDSGKRCQVALCDPLDFTDAPDDESKRQDQGKLPNQQAFGQIGGQRL